MSIYVNGNHSAGNLDHPEAQSDGGKTSLSQNMGKQELPSFLDLVLIFVGKVCILDWWVDYVIWRVVDITAITVFSRGYELQTADLGPLV